MKYRLRDGIVLAEVCGQPMLVATGEALEHCRYMSLINTDAAFYMRLLEEPVNAEEMAENASVRFSESPEKLLPGLMSFLKAGEARGYIVRAEQDISNDT